MTALQDRDRPKETEREQEPWLLSKSTQSEINSSNSKITIDFQRSIGGSSGQAKRAGGSINKCSAASPVRLVRVQHIRSRSLSSSSSPPLDPPFRGPSNVQKKKKRNKNGDDDDLQRSVWKAGDMPYNNEMAHTRAVPKSGPTDDDDDRVSLSLGVSAPQWSMWQ